MDRYVNFVLGSVGVFLLAAAALFGVVTYQVLVLPRVVGEDVTSRLNHVEHLVDARDKQLEETIKNVNTFFNATYYDNEANVETLATILRESSEIVHNVRLDVLPKVGTVLSDASVLLRGVRLDVDKVAVDVEGTLKPLNATLDNAAGLLKTLDEEVKVGSPKAQETVVELTKTLGDLDRLIADPNIQATLANVEGTTEHLKGSAESIDIALKPLRDKITALKRALNVALGMLKFTVPVF